MYISYYDQTHYHGGHMENIPLPRYSRRELITTVSFMFVRRRQRRRGPREQSIDYYTGA